MIPGVDVFAGYGAIDFNLVASAGYRFAYIKGQEGNTGKDPAYERNVMRARDAGIIVGAYSFAFPLPSDPKHPGRGPLEQAELYFRACSGLGSQPGELSPSLDLEWPPPEEWAKWKCSPQQISDWGHECAEAMTLLWGRSPVIYTYPFWWRTLALGADVSWAARYPLWFADYAWPGEGTPPNDWTPPHLSWVEQTWQQWAVCQHSADGSKVRVPGIPACPVDRDVVRNEATLAMLTDQAVSTEPVPYRAEPEPAIVHVLDYTPDSEPPEAA